VLPFVSKKSHGNQERNQVAHNQERNQVAHNYLINQARKSNAK
jgi:hypothetical protein